MRIASILMIILIPISYIHSQIVETCSAKNDAGIDLFLEHRYEEALQKFDDVLSSANNENTSDVEMGTALWGKMLCDGALEKMEQLEIDIKNVKTFFLDSEECDCTKAQPLDDISSLLASSWFDRPQGQVAPDVPFQYADPDEEISVNECINRVESTADALRMGVACLKKREVVWILNRVIQEIADASIRCCKRGGFWTKCISPIISKLKKWKMFGIPDDPAWDN